MDCFGRAIVFVQTNICRGDARRRDWRHLLPRAIGWLLRGWIDLSLPGCRPCRGDGGWRGWWDGGAVARVDRVVAGGVSPVPGRRWMAVVLQWPLVPRGHPVGSSGGRSLGSRLPFPTPPPP